MGREDSGINARQPDHCRLSKGQEDLSTRGPSSPQGLLKPMPSQIPWENSSVFISASPVCSSSVVMCQAPQWIPKTLDALSPAHDVYLCMSTYDEVQFVVISNHMNRHKNIEQ